jgi:hypothetical protein
MQIFLRTLRSLIVAITIPMASAASAADVDIVDAEFGIFDASNAGEIVFTPATIVPHRSGQRYGWVIAVRTRNRALSVREEYLLPNATPVPPPDNPVAANLAIPLERHNQVSQRQLVPVDGRIVGEWAIGPNEPAGHRQLQVVIEGVPAARFDYDVK